MKRQVGFEGLFERLKNEAPRYVQLLPELPRLLHQSLQPRPSTDVRLLEALLAEQRSTNRLLRAVVWGVIAMMLIGFGMWLGRHA